jgi:hypothetical protein
LLVQAEADMLSDTARLSPSADADEIVQSRAGIARKPAGCVTTQPKAPRGTNTADGFTSADSSSSAARSERGHAPRRASPALDREAPEFAVRCFGERTECGECATAARWLREPNTRPPDHGGGGVGQQLMREPTKSAIFRLPRRREPVSATPASWSGLGDM